MTNQSKAFRNVAILVLAGVKALKAAGWSEAQITEHLPVLAAEAVAYLASKA